MSNTEAIIKATVATFGGVIDFTREEIEAMTESFNSLPSDDARIILQNHWNHDLTKRCKEQTEKYPKFPGGKR